MLERLFPSVGRKDIFPMKCVATQGTRKLRPKDNKEANLGILEHFAEKNLGILEFLCFLRPEIRIYYDKLK